jgi:hypothetical protein
MILIVTSQDIELFDAHDSGVLLGRVQDDARNAYEAYTENEICLVRYVMQFVIGVVLDVRCIERLQWRRLVFFRFIGRHVSLGRKRLKSVDQV